jgi:hypothetical protein
MSQSIFQVVESQGQWSIVHRGESLATFPTSEEAEHAATTLASKCPQRTDGRQAVADQGR